MERERKKEKVRKDHEIYNVTVLFIHKKAAIYPHTFYCNTFTKQS